jgi:hypothetical protein
MMTEPSVPIAKGGLGTLALRGVKDRIVAMIRAFPLG